ncbi:glycoside hydrolase family 127 protein [Demequina sp. NBRC 110056]|uniref:glycoside hydrolase family 127 protein n=1 Tax=Demequina sp. NBRC 110056 TaxID=1570345 RepID=UPI0009FC12AC|nr:beta-L-arabinofuranosidase domain-containing protein [Demequina sp. NBRC 110056]
MSTTTVRTPVTPARPTHSRPRDAAASALSGGLLGDWSALNTQATIPHVIERLETSGVIDNFRRLVGRSDADFRGPVFADSDLFKTLEALGWEAVGGRRSHEEFLAEVLELLEAVQAEDGYLNTSFQGPRLGERFTDMQESHELYCLGHLIQAAVAWHHAGDDALLTIALRYVELVHTTFGPGARDEVCGHPEIETALVELSRVTGDPRHRELALRMVDLRGHDTVGNGYFGGNYYQDKVPVREAEQAEGHAVRQLYLLAGVADLATDLPDTGLDEPLDRLWADVHDRKLYITGGLGSRHRGESFGDPYELPADRAYSETCAAIANFHWNWRMLLLRGGARYADEMERGLYNAIAVSTAADGCSYFYSNPLQLRTEHVHEVDAPSRRLDWYDCACCPPNIARMIASLPGYLTSEDDEAVYLHLYADGTHEIDGVTATVQTEYPWDPSISITFSDPSPKALRMRVPGWAAGAQLEVDGTSAACTPGTYVEVPAGALAATLTLPLTPTLVSAHPRVDAVRGAVAVQRGPVVYCLETAALPQGTMLEDVELDAQATVADGAWHDELGVPAVAVGPAAVRPAQSALYSPATRDDAAATTVLDTVDAIPYFRWANRSSGAMRVWLPIA